jgi:hypothetical protein
MRRILTPFGHKMSHKKAPEAQDMEQTSGIEHATGLVPSVPLCG